MRFGGAIGWALLAGLVHLGILSVVSTISPAVQCDGCDPGRLVDTRDLRYYYAGTSPGRSHEATLGEYPPLAKGLFKIPRLFAASEGSYVRAFMLLMLLVDALIVFVVALRGANLAAPFRLAWYTSYLFMLSPIVFTRFDLVPAFLAFAAASAWGAGRTALGAVGSALGAFVKLFPGCVAAVGFVDEASHRKKARWRGTLVFVLAVAGLEATAWNVRVTVTSFAGGNLQIESTPAGVLMVVSRAAGLPMAIEVHQAVELVTSAARFLVALTLPLQAILLFTVLWRCWRSRTTDFMRDTTAAILALVVAARALSPQYLIWLMPFVAVLGGETGRRARPVFLAACVATAVVYPFRYSDLSAFAGGRWDC